MAAPRAGGAAGVGSGDVHQVELCHPGDAGEAGDEATTGVAAAARGAAGAGVAACEASGRGGREGLGRSRVGDPRRLEALQASLDAPHVVLQGLQPEIVAFHCTSSRESPEPGTLSDANRYIGHAIALIIVPLWPGTRGIRPRDAP
jgi:hypothetical protein